MATIGPTLPPHLREKRKHSGEDAEVSETTSPPNRKSSSPPRSEDLKRRRIAGPAPPPAPVDEIPPKTLADEDSSSSDDEYGPAPISTSTAVGTNKSSASAFDSETTKLSWHEEPKKPKRDEWMMMPPTQDGLAARMDPLKPRAKAFATGRGANASGQKGGDRTMWTESMEEKQKRLQDEVMGIDRSQETPQDVIGESKRKTEEREKARHAKAHKQKTKSLYEQHQSSSTKKEEDDPSKRAFDYEKDVAKGPTLAHAQKKEFLSRAADFGSRFSSGTYL